MNFVTLPAHRKQISLELLYYSSWFMDNSDKNISDQKSSKKIEAK